MVTAVEIRLVRESFPAIAELSGPVAALFYGRLFELARFGANAGRVQIETGIRYYRQAIELDPKFARAWGGLATAHMALTWFGEHPPSETMNEARREAEEARRLDPSLSFSWRVLGFVSHYLDWNHQEAERNFRRAVELNPKEFREISRVKFPEMGYPSWTAPVLSRQRLYLSGARPVLANGIRRADSLRSGRFCSRAS